MHNKYFQVPTIGKIPLLLMQLGGLPDRPPADGTHGFYYDAVDGALYFDNDGVWVLISPTGAGGANMSVDETPAGVIDGINDTFTLAHSPAGGRMFLYVSSIGKCWAGVTYNLVGNVITFTPGNLPQPGDLISATYLY